MLDKCPPHPRHRGASLLIINTDLTKRRQRDGKIRIRSGTRRDYVVCVYVTYDCGEFILGHLVLLSAWWGHLDVSLLAVRKQGSFSKMISPPASPSSLIPTFHPRLHLLSSSNVPPGPSVTRRGRKRINYSPGASATSHAFICTSN